MRARTPCLTLLDCCWCTFALVLLQQLLLAHWHSWHVTVTHSNVGELYPPPQTHTQTHPAPLLLLWKPAVSPTALCLECCSYPRPLTPPSPAPNPPHPLLLLGAGSLLTDCITQRFISVPSPTHSTTHAPPIHPLAALLLLLLLSPVTGDKLTHRIIRDILRSPPIALIGALCKHLCCYLRVRDQDDIPVKYPKAHNTAQSFVPFEELLMWGVCALC